jgi:hypothetical protein
VAFILASAVDWQMHSVSTDASGSGAALPATLSALPPHLWCPDGAPSFKLSEETALLLCS